MANVDFKVKNALLVLGTGGSSIAGQLTVQGSTVLRYADSGIAGGVASLDVSTKVPTYQLPSIATQGGVVNGGGAPSLQEGLQSARPAAGNAGNLYLATDTGFLFRDTGSNWTILGSSTIGQVITGDFGASSGTTLIAADNTVPLSTEGTQIWTQAITPLLATSKIKISTSFWANCGTSNRSLTVTVFRGTTCIQATNGYIRTSGQPITISLDLVDSPATTSATTYSMRVGVNANATWHLNQGTGGTVTYGGTVNSSDFTLMELLR